MQKRRNRIAPKTVARIAARQGTRCAICGFEMRAADYEVDHIVPVARGGSDVARNLRLTHRECNRKRGARIK